MGGIGVIVNPYASGNRRNPRRVARFEGIMGGDGEVVAIHQSVPHKPGG